MNVCDLYFSGEKYIGMWQNDQREGFGIVVTVDGVYYEGPFSQNKLAVSNLYLSVTIIGCIFVACFRYLDIGVGARLPRRLFFVKNPHCSTFLFSSFLFFILLPLFCSLDFLLLSIVHVSPYLF